MCKCLDESSVFYSSTFIHRDTALAKQHLLRMGVNLNILALYRFSIRIYKYLMHFSYCQCLPVLFMLVICSEKTIGLTEGQQLVDNVDSKFVPVWLLSIRSV